MQLKQLILGKNTILYFLTEIGMLGEIGDSILLDLFRCQNE